jgi:3-dehydroquinate dehydratase
MKLSLSFNGAQTTLSMLQTVLGAAGTNSTISINTAQSWSTSNLITLVQGAGTKKLSVDINAAQANLATVQSVLAAASTGTSISMNTCQAWSSNDLVTLVRAAGTKSLTLSFNPAQSNLALLQAVISAAPVTTGLELDTLQAWSSGDLSTLAQAVGSRPCSFDFNGAQSNLSLVRTVLNVVQSNTSLSLNTAQSWSASDLTSLAQVAGTKKLSLDLNGAQANLTLLQSVLGAAKTNTSISMNTAQSWSPADLSALAQSAGTKMLDLSFNAAQSNLDLLQSVLSVASSTTSLSLNTAQSWSSGDLTSLAQAVGSRSMGFSFNGAQSAVSLVSAVIAAARANTRISVNTAQTISASDLASWARAAA